jgi:hypothetical protein
MNEDVTYANRRKRRKAREEKEERIDALVVFSKLFLVELKLNVYSGDLI